MNKQTIDGVLVSREQLVRWEELLRTPPGRQELLDELRALLGAPDQCAHEFESPALSSMPDYCAKCSIDKPAVQPQGEPVAWRYKKSWEKTGWIICDKHPEDLGIYDDCHTIQPLYAEQPAPVAVVLPERPNGGL